MIDTKAIRSKILDLAIRGKLTEQLPEDGTAEELYQQIQAEKQALVKSGKIKKEKPLPEIAEDEIPFEIPCSWKWVNFSSIITLQSGADLKPEEYSSTNVGIPYLTGASNFDEKGHLIINRWTEHPKNIAIKDDVLLSCKGTVGKLAILEIERVHIARQFMAIRTYVVNVKFVQFFMQSVIESIKKAQKGLIPGIERSDILKLNLPLPPLFEQKRIVEKIEQAFSVLDIIDELQAKYADNLTMLKSKLIDLAIRGKLTEQLPEDGTAEELYQQIQEEKQALIKSGKIKKEKPLPPITEEEIPFEIPENWTWVRWGDLSQSIQYGYNAPAKAKGVIRMVRISDIQDNHVLWDAVPYCDISENEISNYLLADNDILFARTGGTVGKSFLVKDVPCDAIYAGYLIRTQYSKMLVPEYMKFFMESQLYWDQLRSGTIATAQPNCNGKTLAKMILPLPPLGEQQRIVDRVNKLLAVCDEMR